MASLWTGTIAGVSSGIVARACPPAERLLAASLPGRPRQVGRAVREQHRQLDADGGCSVADAVAHSSWGAWKELDKPDSYVESFNVASWDEHRRQHERVTHAERARQKHVLEFSDPVRPPLVTAPNHCVVKSPGASRRGRPQTAMLVARCPSNLGARLVRLQAPSRRSVFDRRRCRIGRTHA
jgi:hypothetical protein